MIDNYDMIEDKEAALWDENNKLLSTIGDLDFDLSGAYQKITELEAKLEEARTIAKLFWEGFDPECMKPEAKQLATKYERLMEGWNDTK